MAAETTARPGAVTEASSGNGAGRDGVANSVDNADRGETSAGTKTKAAASRFADTAKEAAKATYGAVSAQAADLASSVAGEIETSAEEQKRRGAETMRTFAGAVQHAADELDQQSPLVARQFRAAAQKVERLSDSLRERSVRDLVSDVSDLARRQPVWFFGGAIVAGFALSRFLKSSGVAAKRNPEQSGQVREASADPVPEQVV